MSIVLHHGCWVRRSAAALLLVALLAPAPASAWLFGDKKKDDAPPVVPLPPSAPAVTGAGTRPDAANAPGTRIVARAHMRFEDPTEERKLLTLIDARRRAQEDFAVVTRLIREKQLELSRFNQQMQEEFAIDPDRNYQYDNDQGIIFELVRKAGLSEEQAARTVIGAEEVNELYDLKRHRPLPDEGERNRFLRLASSKQLANEQINMLSLLQSEKQMEVETLHAEMARLYAVSVDREYRYDNDSKTLYELVTLPADAQGTAPIPSQNVKTR
jgi:hypothetical protein